MSLSYEEFHLAKFSSDDTPESFCHNMAVFLIPIPILAQLELDRPTSQVIVGVRSWRTRGAPIVCPPLSPVGANESLPIG